LSELMMKSSSWLVVVIKMLLPTLLVTKLFVKTLPNI
jgi:hypothetical protein